MIRIGLIGLGFMGRTHLEIYDRLEREGDQVVVTALCDVDPLKMEGGAVVGNIGSDTGSSLDFNRYRKYTSVADMLENEQLDAVDITLPTFLHKDVAIQCLRHGVHVLCEKPMARDFQQCADMSEAAANSGRQLMIGQCLRFWPAYVRVKKLVEEQTYGKVLAASFYRGGGTPTWGAWLTNNELSGGAMLDMHVHDTDVVNWLFGKPKSVSCQARNVIPGSGYDIVSTHYQYEDGKIVNAQADWTLQGDYGFDMSFRVNFERGNIVLKDGVVRENPNEGKGFVPELSPSSAITTSCATSLIVCCKDKPIEEAGPNETMDSIAIIEAEIRSANSGGAWTEIG